MRSAILCATLFATPFLAGSLTGQSSTLPKGWDTTEGTDTYSTTNSYFWANFDLGSTSNAQYNPARSIYMYDSSVFPWNPTGVKAITKISFRRDGPSLAADSTAHTRKWVVIMSTSSHPPAQANFNTFESNHGSNRVEVFGKVGTPKDVTFKRTPQPTAPATAPFDVEVILDTPFIVLPNAKTLVVEIRSYTVSGAASGWWRVDAVRYPSTNYNGGGYQLINTDHCAVPLIYYNSRAMTTGSDFGHIWRTNKAPGGKQVLTWLGIPNPTPFPFPGTSCNVHVYPPLLIRFDTTEMAGRYSAYISWGKVPLNPTLVGGQISHQSMFVDASYPGGVALSRGGTSTVGSGYDPTMVPMTAVYSYGPQNTRFLPSMDPDNEKHARNFYRRCPIIKIN